MKRTAASPVGRALLLAAGVSAFVGGTAFIGPPDAVVEEHSEQLEPVVRSTTVCPYIGGEARASSRIGVLALAGLDDPEWSSSDEDEPIVVRRLAGPDDEPRAFMTVTDRGHPLTKAVEGSNPAAYAVHAEGPLAPGVVAEQVMLAQGPDLRGLSTAPCTAPSSEHWFVGTTTDNDQRGRLLLTNASETAAVVTVSLWDEAGPVETAGTKDISIPPRSQEVLVLDVLAPDAEQVGVRVRASRGRVAAALDYRERDADESRGVTMIPAAAQPSTSLTVPGVPGHGDRSLRIVAPGETDAIVSLRVLGIDGPFSPLDHDVVTVPAGTVVEVPMSDALGDSPAAIALDSDEEITAAVRVVSSRSDELPELAYSAATAPLPTGPAAAVLSRDTADVSSRLLLTAVGDVGGRVEVTTIGRGGDVVDEQSLDIPAGSTVEADLESGDGTDWAFTVVQASAPNTVVVARETYGSDEDGRLLDLMPLIAPASTVPVPRVVGELPAGLGSVHDSDGDED